MIKNPNDPKQPPVFPIKASRKPGLKLPSLKLPGLSKSKTFKTFKSLKDIQLKKPSKLRFRRKGADSKITQAMENLPRITNETLAEHREEMLHSARRFIYPLQHSRQRIVKVSIALFAMVIVVFIGYVLLSLYKLQSASTFIYSITRVVQLPVARAGNSWVSYESYLFELRHYKHYYETQQQVDFATDSGRDQLLAFKKQALGQVIDDAYVKQLAAKNNVSTSNQEVDDAVRLLREQNRLGSNDQEFADVLKEFWGWSIDDFRRELRQQLLAQKVVASLDSSTADKARTAFAALQNGTEFAAAAQQFSDDEATKATGGEYSFLIDRSNRDVAPKVVDELYKLQPGQTSQVIDTGYALEIVKVLSAADGKVRAAHISKNYKPVTAFTKPLQDKSPPQQYIKF